MSHSCTPRPTTPASQQRTAPAARSLVRVGWRLATRLGAIFALLAFYSWFRKTYFLRPDALAFDHARDIIRWQERLGLDIELALQQRALDHPWLIDLVNASYRNMKPALLLSAALALVLAPAAFGRVARVFVVATALAFPWYALYPLAPPRLMADHGYPFVDTLAAYGGVVSSSAGAGGANQFAAMPSMHIGWSAVAALWLAAALPWRRVGAFLGALHLGLMTAAVVITGNHYVLDVVAGLLLVGIAIVIARRLPPPLGYRSAAARR